MPNGNEAVKANSANVSRQGYEIDEPAEGRRQDGPGRFGRLPGHRAPGAVVGGLPVHHLEVLGHVAAGFEPADGFRFAAGFLAVVFLAVVFLAAGFLVAFFTPAIVFSAWC